jgi:hypothetical protein
MRISATGIHRNTLVSPSGIGKLLESMQVATDRVMPLVKAYGVCVSHGRKRTDV